MTFAEVLEAVAGWLEGHAVTPIAIAIRKSYDDAGPRVVADIQLCSRDVADALEADDQIAWSRGHNGAMHYGVRVAEGLTVTWSQDVDAMYAPKTVGDVFGGTP